MIAAPLAIDLFCGLGGWTEGLLAEGWRVRGYDIEAHEYGDEKYPAELILQDIMELHGSELADADLIVASPPCQEFSYMAMPWKRAKQIARALRGEGEFPEPYRGSRTTAELTALFNACFRIQREASEAAGRHIPMVVENVKGAQPWVGRAGWNFGSFYLWGDVPALMPAALAGQKFNPDGTAHPPGSWFAVADSKHRGTKNTGGSWFNIGSPGQKVTGRNPVHAIAADGVKVPAEPGSGRRTDVGNGARFTSRDCGVERIHGVDNATGTKIGGDWFSYPTSTCRRHGSKSKARKQASALIAKIPLALSTHISRVYKPKPVSAAA